MGLNVYDNGAVMFDDTHQKRVNTSLQDNPTVSQVGGIKVRHVYRRNRTGDRDRDGNPLIYALKGMNGYSIVPMYRTMFMNQAAEILTTFVDELRVDAIVPVPSSKAFCGEFTALVGQVAGIPVVQPDFLGKRTVAEMLAQYGDKLPDGLSGTALKSYKSQLADWRRLSGGQLVSMKDLDTHIRPYFDPLAMRGDATHISGLRVIIADDLVSSGASISATALRLQDVGAEVVSAVSFLSGL